MLRQCIVAATRLQQCHRLLQQCCKSQQLHSLATKSLPATCSFLPQVATTSPPATSSLLPQMHSMLHTSSNVSQQQQDTSMYATVAATPPPAMAGEEGATESGSNEEQIFQDDDQEGKAFIAPSTTDSLVFNGVPFNELAIVHIKATYNNTHVSVADHKGITVTRTSCGTEGFKNAKKGTAIAAQTAGIAAATKALDKGMNMVRVVIKGIGPGRQTAIKGLQMGGLEIISITDNTPVPHNGCRPRKARR